MVQRVRDGLSSLEIKSRVQPFSEVTMGLKLVGSAFLGVRERYRYDKATSLIVKFSNEFGSYSNVNPGTLHSQIVTRSRRVFDASTIQLKEAKVCTKAKNTVLMKATTPAQKKESVVGRFEHSEISKGGTREQKSAPLGQVWGMKKRAPRASRIVCSGQRGGARSKMDSRLVGMKLRPCQEPFLSRLSRSFRAENWSNSCPRSSGFRDRQGSNASQKPLQPACDSRGSVH